MVFFKIRTKKEIICVRLEAEFKSLEENLHMALFECVHDVGNKIFISNFIEWDYNIEYGNSYEIATEKEVKLFIKNNIKQKQYRTEII